MLTQNSPIIVPEPAVSKKLFWWQKSALVRGGVEITEHEDDMEFTKALLPAGLLRASDIFFSVDVARAGVLANKVSISASSLEP